MSAKQMLAEKIKQFSPDRQLADIEREILQMSWADRLKLYGDLRVREVQQQIVMINDGQQTGTVAHILELGPIR